ncbi:glycosyltransferase family 2 protein [Longispora urticae]
MTGLLRISIVILCHNYGRYLDQAITSCLHQEPGDYVLHEIVVIDDGSTDETLDVCARHGDRIRMISRAARGFGQTLTDAIQFSTGDWVAPLDADDWLHPAKLRTCAAAISEKVMLLQHWEHVVGEDGQPILERPHPGGNTSTLLIRRDVALSLLPVSNEIFFHALREVGHGVELPDPLTYYRVHDQSMTDRRTPGLSQDYRASVTLDLVERLNQLRLNPPNWAAASHLKRATWHFRALAARHQAEAALQHGARGRALHAFGRMLIDTIRAGDPLSPCGRVFVSVMSGRPLVRLDRVSKEQPEFPRAC